jgi:hypothetical protein
MATILSEMKTIYLVYYKDISTNMTAVGSIYDTMMKKLEDSFTNFGLSEEQKAQLISQAVMTIMPQYEQMASKATLDILNIESERPIKDSQRKEVDRKYQFYDDKVLIEMIAKQGDLASFAVNANSSTAQDTINDLKAKMVALTNRVVSLDGESACPAPDPIIPVPATVSASAITDVSLTLTWASVSGATGYVVYRDGVQIASTGLLYINDSGLTQLTKYAYNVKVVSGSLTSDLSPTVVTKTLVTV